MSVRMIKPGKDNDPKLLFICNCCGSVLEAGIGEYTWVDAGARGIAAVCTCPNCGDDCYRYDLKRLLRERKAEIDKCTDKSEAQDHNHITRGEILDAAKTCVCTDRNRQYGEPEDNFTAIADIWMAHFRAKKLDVRLTPIDVALMLTEFKIARALTATSQKADTYIDLAGYAACGGEIATRQEDVKKE